MPEDIKKEAIEAATSETLPKFDSFKEFMPEFNTDGPITLQDWRKGRGKDISEPIHATSRFFERIDTDNDGIITKDQII